MDKAKSLLLKQKLYRTVPEKYRGDMDELYQKVDYPNYSPVRRFENAVGISGIYHAYNIPGSMTPEEYEAGIKPMRVFEMIERGYYPALNRAVDYLFDIYDDFLKEIKTCYVELQECNPELKNIKPYNTEEIRSYVALISGVCSGFPPEDIAAFVAARDPAANECLNRRKAEMSEEIEKITGKHGEKFINLQGKTRHYPLIDNWCPSEQTYQKILGKVRQKYSPAHYCRPVEVQQRA